MNQQDPYLTGRPIPPHLRQHDVVGDSPLNPRRQDALNARANQAWRLKCEAEGWDPNPFYNQSEAYEEGWETGYKTARAELAEEIAVLLEAQNDDDPCLRFDGYNHVDGCGAVGLECAAAIVRKFGSAS